jgi:branched-chain amino acid transport system ATP-binding protein
VPVIIGSNGAGKRTLLKAIAGLIKPYSGKIYFKNIDITGLPVHKVRKLGLSLVLQGKRLFPNLTVWENLLTGGFNIKNEEELRARIEWLRQYSQS